MESILAVMIGALLGPLFTWMFKRFPSIDEQLGAMINLYVCVAMYLLAWVVVADGDKAQLETYFLWALAAAGVGGAGNNYYRKRMTWQARVARHHRSADREEDQ